MRDTRGRFIDGHSKIGGFSKGDSHSPQSKAKIVVAMLENRNRWLGNKAGYHAVHQWLTAHYSKGNACERCATTKASRLEWANVSGEYLRDRSDYLVLCPSCHRLMDGDGKCRKGHIYTPESTYVNTRGHRWCLTCREAKT